MRVIFSILLMSMSFPAFAAPPTIAASTCDPDYYDTLKSRAWLEAQREITQNQNLIAKPDSVLRFSCFDQVMDDFSSAYADTSDVSVAKSAASSFVGDNFSSAHGNMIGGRSDESSGLDGACDVMAKVWEDAQCMNFADEPDSDAFFTIAEYSAGADKRFEGSCSTPSGWSDELDALAPDGTTWEEDSVQTLMSEFDVNQTECSASKMIDVGVRALATNSNSYTGVYDVKVCLVQGCVYVPSGETSGACDEPET